MLPFSVPVTDFPCRVAEQIPEKNLKINEQYGVVHCLAEKNRRLDGHLDREIQ